MLWGGGGGGGMITVHDVVCDSRSMVSTIVGKWTFQSMKGNPATISRTCISHCCSIHIYK